MLRIAWSVGPDASGRSVVEPGGKLVLARRMTLPEQRPVVVEDIAGSTYVLVRLPYVSDPAVVVQAGPGHPVLHRGQRANGVVLEVVTPADFVGPIQADLNQRYARIVGSEHRGDLTVLTAEVGLARMFGYSTHVRSLSQGRASYSMEPLKYDLAPPSVLEEMMG